MNIWELFSSWGVNYLRIVQDGQAQNQLFVSCSECLSEFTSTEILAHHRCVKTSRSQFECLKFREIYAVNERECKICHIVMPEFYKLLEHYIENHTNSSQRLYKQSDWYIVED